MGKKEKSVPEKPQRLFGKFLCGSRASEIGVHKAPETALSAAIRQCRATQEEPIAAARRPEVGFSNSLSEVIRAKMKRGMACRD
jgi:hypothetical protein